MASSDYKPVPASGGPPPAAILRWAGLLGMLIVVFTRMMVSVDPFPYWDVDPTTFWLPTTALGPAGSLVLDCIALACAGLALIGEVLSGRPLRAVPLILGAIGSGGVVVHAFGFAAGGGLSVEDARIGFSWVSAIATALAATHLCRDSRMARVTAALAIGLMGALASKGLLQYFIEHPETRENFRANRDAFLAARGWSPDSAMARAYIRRIDQAEATGWFGLANVFASFASFATIALAGLAISAWRASRPPRQAVPDGVAGVLTLGAVGATVCVFLAGSKAGAVVVVLGFSLLLFGVVVRSGRFRSAFVADGFRRSFGGAIGLAVIALSLGAVLVRGAVGERIGELSLLFRWFYIQAAARITVENPLLGVGPAGFKDAYLLAKNPLSPEEVSSPHSVLFDWSSALGVFAIPWILLLAWWAVNAGRVLTMADGANAGAEAPRKSSGVPASRLDAWAAIFIAAVPTLISSTIELAAATPDAALSRVAGIVAWVGITLCVLVVMREGESWRWVLAAAALALAAHAQIELTPTLPASASWFLLVMACAGASPAAPPARVRARAAGLSFGAACLCGAAAVGLWCVVPAARWQAALRRAAEVVRPLGELQPRMAALSANPRPAGGDTPQRISEDVLAAIASLRDPASGAYAPRGPQRDFAYLYGLACRRAELELRERAIEALPTHAETIRTTARVDLNLAGLEHDLPTPGNSTDWADLAEQLAVRATRLPRQRASSLGWLGTVRAARGALAADAAAREGHIRGAVEAWRQAAALDPHGLTFRLRVFEALVSLGDPSAKAAAADLLACDANLRLDRASQLTDKQRSEAQRVAREGVAAPRPGS